MAKEHVDALINARERLVESRRKLAVALGSQRGDTDTWRKELTEVQTTIQAIDSALLDETDETAPTTDA
jgi:hypothetical protein